jgi:hypothetical protein
MKTEILTTNPQTHFLAQNRRIKHSKPHHEMLLKPTQTSLSTFDSQRFIGNTTLNGLCN